jgi:hypothetical protein
MTEARGELTAERLRELLSYDPETGVFTWRVNRRRWKAGQMAGTIVEKGYIRIRVDDRLYLAHRLAVLYVTGSWPADQVDHVNGVKADNRIANIRECTPGQNARNRKRRCGGASDLKGAYRASGGRWSSSITHNRRRFYLGVFDTQEEAHAAYCAAAQEHHGEFARIPSACQGGIGGHLNHGDS